MRRVTADSVDAGRMRGGLGLQSEDASESSGLGLPHNGEGHGAHALQEDVE
jgi:hypothetical protein